MFGEKKLIPLGVQHFKHFSAGKHIYVDKTKLLLKLLYNDTNRFYFLGRPRRFGKSLTISTLKEIFQGNKDLFKGTFAYDNYWDWGKSYPVIFADFAGFDKDSHNDNLTKFVSDRITIYIDNQSFSLKEYLNKYGTTSDFKNNEVSELSILIKKIAKDTNKEVVILFDEYDQPFAKNIDNSLNFQKIKTFFAKFYGQVKSTEEIRFFYLSGLSKVGQTSMDSALNNLIDLTFDKDYYNIVGYTLDEIKNYFKDYIIDACKFHNLSEEDLLKKLKIYYNGYYYGNEEDRVFNAWSVNSFFMKMEFTNYWTNTGFLTAIELSLKGLSKEKYVEFLNNLDKKQLEYESTDIIINDVENLLTKSLFLQTGYLTKKDKKLVIPNKEAREEVYGNFLKILGNNGKRNQDALKAMINTIEDGFRQNDTKKLEKALNEIIEFTDFPVEWTSHNTEGGIKIGLSFYFQACDFDKVTNEESHLRGRADIAIYDENQFYLIEVKVDGKRNTALDQINEQYLSAYKDKKGYKVGINFLKKEKRIEVTSEPL